MQISNRLFFEAVESTLAEGSEVQIAVRGNSMRPLLRDGRDRVVLRPCAGHDCRPGDVVLFRHGGRHVLHRIVLRDSRGFVLRGDGNYRIEERCAERDVLAVMTHVIRPSGATLCCSSRRWKRLSRLWLALHPFIRRCILALLSRLSIG